MVIVDTTVWVDYLNGVPSPETRWLDAALDRQRLGITELVLCEVLQGVRDETEAARVERELRKLEVFEAGTAVLAVEAARHYRALRSRGHTVRKTIDCLIAAFCIRERHTLLHNDRDFDAFEKYLGLVVVHPDGLASPNRPHEPDPPA